MALDAWLEGKTVEQVEEEKRQSEIKTQMEATTPEDEGAGFMAFMAQSTGEVPD